MLKDCCSVCNFADDGFIGIHFENGLPHVSFPRGYTISEDDDGIRKDILGLMAVLQRFSNQHEGQNISDKGNNQSVFPILSYVLLLPSIPAHKSLYESNCHFKSFSI